MGAFSFPVAVSLAQREWIQEQKLGIKAAMARTLGRQKWFLFNPGLVTNTESEIKAQTLKKKEQSTCLSTN